MELTAWNVKHPYPFHSLYSNISNNSDHKKLPLLKFSTYPFQFHYFKNIKSSPLTSLTHARKKNSKFEASPVTVTKPSIIEQVSESNDAGIEEEEELVADDDYNDEEFSDDEGYFEDEYETEDAEVYAGDGVEGGGILLAGTRWDKEALAIAEKVVESFDGDLGMYAFRTLVNGTIQVRVEKLSNKSGSPSISDIEAFTVAYRTRLDEAELAKTLPENVSLEVSSPGVERVVRVPQDLDRFKERPMYVKYVTEGESSTGSSSENDGVFRLVSFDLETKSCTWGLADVRINREKAGKGRPMSKKQREWRLTTPFDSIHLVRIYSEI